MAQNILKTQFSFEWGINPKPRLVPENRKEKLMEHLEPLPMPQNDHLLPNKQKTVPFLWGGQDFHSLCNVYKQCIKCHAWIYGSCPLKADYIFLALWNLCGFFIISVTTKLLLEKKRGLMEGEAVISLKTFFAKVNKLCLPCQPGSPKA